MQCGWNQQLVAASAIGALNLVAVCFSPARIYLGPRGWGGICFAFHQGCRLAGLVGITPVFPGRCPSCVIHAFRAGLSPGLRMGGTCMANPAGRPGCASTARRGIAQSGLRAVSSNCLSSGNSGAP